jgi:hypothetical protein
LANAILTAVLQAVDAYGNALRTEAPGEPPDQRGIGQRRRIDRDFLRAGREYVRRVLERGDAARDAERYVEDARDARHPSPVDGTSLGTRGDVVEHELVGALRAVSRRELQDVADHAVIAKPDALDHLAIANVRQGIMRLAEWSQLRC